MSPAISIGLKDFLKSDFNSYLFYFTAYNFAFELFEL
jgi:hypothetical protein